MSLTLAEIGLSQEVLQERLIESLRDSILCGSGADYAEDTGIKRELKDAVKTTISAAVNKIANEDLLPRVEASIKQMTFQETNSWGDSKAPPQTFTELLVARADKYMTEIVDLNGRSESECRARNDSFYGTKKTRIVHLIHQHLANEIDSAMKKIVGDANSILVKALHETCKAQLQEIANKLKVSVQV